MTTRVPTSLIRSSYPVAYPLKNHIINGDFRKWQRGDSFSDPNSEYTADRWKADTVFGTGAGTVSRGSFNPGQQAVPGEPRHFLRFDLTAAADTAGSILRQPIEDVRTLAGGKVTISFAADMGSGQNKNFQVRLVQNFGAGGSASVITNSFIVNVTETWALFEGTVTVPSVTNSTIGEGSYLELQIRDEDPGSTYQLSLANVQVEIGDRATAFEKLPDWLVDNQCLRYYLDASPNDNYSQKYYRGSGAGVASMRGGPITFPAPMRTVPTMTAVNESHVNANNLDLNAFVTERAFIPQWDETQGTSDITVRFGYQADAEL